jgi:hypothetical protein
VAACNVKAGKRGTTRLNERNNKETNETSPCPTSWSNMKALMKPLLSFENNPSLKKLQHQQTPLKPPPHLRLVP